MNEQTLRRPSFSERMMGFHHAERERDEHLEDRRAESDPPPDLKEMLALILSSLFSPRAQESLRSVHADKMGMPPDFKPVWWDYTPEEMEQYREEVAESEAIRNGQVDFWRYPGDE